MSGVLSPIFAAIQAILVVSKKEIKTSALLSFKAFLKAKNFLKRLAIL